MRKSILLIVLSIIGIITGMAQNTYDTQWAEVDSFVRKGLPQSALGVADQIYASAKAENNAPQFLKASIYMIKLQADFQEDYMEKNIARITSEIESSPEPQKQILHSVLAELYNRYFESNLYIILDRTVVAEPDAKDIKTWDSQSFIDMITNHYLSSLDNPSLLQQTALGMYDPIIEQEEGSRKYRTTLYDFLGHRALDYFMSPNLASVIPPVSFYIDISDYFKPAAEFVNFALDHAGDGDYQLQSLHLMQKLIRFHLNDSDPVALIDVDLKRLRFVEENSVMPERFDLYLEALQHIQSKYSAHPNSTDASYEIAVEYLRRGTQYNPFISEDHRWDIQNAAKTCQQAINTFPGSDGARNCEILLEEINTTRLSVTVNYATLPELPFLASISFRNINKVYLRIVAVDPKEDRKLRQTRQPGEQVEKYRAAVPLESWALDLPNEGDFQDHNTDIKVPALPKGYYVILVSDNPDFSFDKKMVAYASFWVTGIGYISESGLNDGKLQVMVMDRQKGLPLKGVSAQAYAREYDYNTRSYIDRPLDNYLTDDEGRIEVPSDAKASKTFYLEFFLGNDKFFTDNYFYVYPPAPDPKTQEVTYFFTDRSIYRPGQVIYFKGIMMDRTGERSVIKPDFATTVALYDVNGQKVSEQLLKTNEFGSFNGVFTAPTGGLTGEVSIRNNTGGTSVSVEEYKRPKFKVEIDSLEGSYKLNELVTVTGKAIAYAGNPIDQATVKYRVVRTVRFPIWHDWWYWYPQVPQTEVTNGETITAADGSFTFNFIAFPDHQVDKKFQPVFNYRIYVDVTDIAGEVRSSEEMVSVGYQAMLLDANVPDKVNMMGDNDFRITATNLNGRPVKAMGSLAVYPLVGPSRLIRERSWQRPDVFVMTEQEFRKYFPNEHYANETDPETWQKGKSLCSKTFDSEAGLELRFDNISEWKQGYYVLVLESTDDFGQKVETKKYFTVYNPGDDILPENKPFWKAALKNSGEPGDTAVFVIGTGEKSARLFYEIGNDEGIVDREWMNLGQEKTKVSIPIREEYRGNIFVNFVMVKENRSYQVTEKITVPYTDRELRITTETFRSKLLPGQEQEWRIRISGMNGEKVAAELLASMYDASLDAFLKHNWSFPLYSERNSPIGWEIQSAFTQAVSMVVRNMPQTDKSHVTREYDRLNWFGFNYYGRPMPRWAGGNQMLMKNMDGMAAPGMADQEQTVAEEVVAFNLQQPPAPKVPDVPFRRNFAETAFFYPSLGTDENGDVIFKFTVPESLTAWNFMMLAYTKDLKTGQLEKEVITQKDLMVMSNPPRFFREGDVISFSAKVVSLSGESMQGIVTAEFFDALTMQPVDDRLVNLTRQQDFDIEKSGSQVFYWQVTIPEGMEAVVCRVKAVSGNLADGEEITIPVLPNRMLVTESLPMPVNGNTTRNFTFEKLVNSGKLLTLKSYRLTLEYTSNPAWYAVQALPYLAEGGNECADYLFNRFYANSLAAYIANSNPKIRQVIESWKNQSPDAFLSNLEKNQELKSVLLNETPWVMEARNETERKQRMAVLFDLNRMTDEKQVSLRKLKQLQSPNGGWPWFEGMPDNRYITQYILTGLGKLDHLGVIDLDKDQVVMGMVRKALAYMDARIAEDYENIKKIDKVDMGANHLGTSQVQYLYARSLVKDIVDVSPSAREAFDYFQGQAKKYWLKQEKYLQGMIALALFRYGVEDVPMDILNSLRERATWDEELGLYWYDEGGYYWHQAPIERQALMIEAFSEVAQDQGAVEQLKVWLLKQKQTQDWKTPSATADAIYALLLKGTDLLASDELVQVTVGGVKIDPLQLDGVNVQAGTGYFQTSWNRKEITPQMGSVSVTKKDEGIAWGAMYWQYYEQLDKITPAKTPLSIEKELYIEQNTPGGPVLVKVQDTTSLKTGDRLKVRIVIRTDRDLEFVHMKDMRAAAFEPVEALSGYRYQGGLGYYESIRDASVNFFFDYLRKGTYVFEYPLNVTQQGEFSNGISTIQCLYAPEFAAHSQGVKVKVD
jgi:5-hydroxyisourate hydrolase-like protein (transthyretin family)